VEIEANLRAILIDNGYMKFSNLTMRDYNKVEISHRLSGYRIKVPYWRGQHGVRTPFVAWAGPADRLLWYQNYNAVKHDRHVALKRATFGTLTDAVCGLVAVLAAQFHTVAFGPGDTFLSLGDSRGPFETCIGGYFEMAPSDWPAEQRYAFTRRDWDALANEDDPFINFPYDLK
jgi:hypothetical protein